MPTCPRCGRPLAAPDAPFCAYCGQPVNQPVQNMANAPQPQQPPNQPPAYPPQAPSFSSLSGTPPVPPYQPAPPAMGAPGPYYPYGQPQAPMPPPYGVPFYGAPMPGYPATPYAMGVGVTRPVDATRGVLLTAGLIGSTFVLVVILALVLPIRILILDYRMENFFVSDNVPLSAAFLKVFWIQGLILLTGWAGGAFWLALLRLRQVSAVQAWLEAMGTTLVLMLAGNSLFMLLALLSFAHPNGINISFGGNPFFGRSLPFFFNSAFWISNVIAALVLGSLGFLFALGAASWSQVRQPGQSSTFVRDYARIVPATFLVMLATLLITYWYGDRIANSIALLGLPLIGLSAWAHCDVMRVLRRDQPALFAPQPSATPPGVPVKANAAMPFAIAAIALLGVAVLGFFVLPRVTAGVINSSFNLFTNNAGQLLIYSIIAIAMMLVALGLSIAYLAVINRAGMRGLRLGLAIGGLAATVIALIAAVWYDHVIFHIDIILPDSFSSNDLAFPSPGIWLSGLLLIAAIIVLLIELGQEAQPQAPQ